jgi:aspartate/methionine/tyrosine aminotransferase
MKNFIYGDEQEMKRLRVESSKEQTLVAFSKSKNVEYKGFEIGYVSMLANYHAFKYFN